MSIYSQNRVKQAQINYQENNLQLATNAIQTTSLLQDLLTQDYSQWDDMAEAVTTQDLEWIQKEFFGPLQIYQVEAVWIYDSAGTLLFSEQRDPQRVVTFNVTDAASLKKTGSAGDSFFDWSGNQLIKYKISPITSHTNSDSAVAGYLVVADSWDQVTLDSLSRLINADVSVDHTTKPTAQSTNQSVIALKNWRNETIAHLLFTFQDDSLLIITQALLAQQLIIGGLGLIGLIMSVLSLSKWIIKPLTALTKKLSRAIPESQLCDLEKCGDEFDVLSQLVDNHLDQNTKITQKNEELKATTATLETTLADLEKSRTELKHKLALSRRLTQAVESATDAIIITSKDKKIIYVNPAWQQLNGYTLLEAKGQNPNILKSSKTEKSVYTRMWQELTSGRPFTTESVINKRKDGTFYHAQISVFPIIEEGEIVSFVGIAQDISKRKEVEQMKTEFISLASHQLRTPLSAMRWFSELLLKSKQCDSHPEQAEWIEKVNQSTIRMINMVNDLLNISRLESGRLKIVPESIEVPTLIKNLISQFEPLLKQKQISLKENIEDKITTIKADPKLLQEVMANLISNAIKYTPEKGKVIISSQLRSDSFVIIVADTGVGIPEKEQANLFKRFFRGSNAQDMNIEGTGLGLFLVRLLVHAWGGEVWVESQLKVGTKVSFSIPLEGMVGRPGEVDLSPSNEIDQLPDQT